MAEEAAVGIVTAAVDGKGRAAIVLQRAPRNTLSESPPVLLRSAIAETDTGIFNALGTAPMFGSRAFSARAVA